MASANSLKMKVSNMSDGLRAMWMRGGTSKGGYFLASDLPASQSERNALLMRVMGSPDPRQIDGLGGGDPLTSKVAIVGPSSSPDADLDYLFLQVFVDRPVVSDSQNCGNILAGVGPFAIERGLVEAEKDETSVVVRMMNTGKTAAIRVPTPGGKVCYGGNARIDGVPGTAAPIRIEFRDTAGSACGELFPTGRKVDEMDGLPATLIDNGMPCVILRAADLDISGDEEPSALEANSHLRLRLESVRLKAGPAMNLGDVREKSVPKLALVSPPREAGAIAARVFIPHRCHTSIGVLGAVTVATSAAIPGTVGSEFAVVRGGRSKDISVEHPTGQISIVCHVGDGGNIVKAEVIRTARKLFDGTVFPSRVQDSSQCGPR